MQYYTTNYDMANKKRPKSKKLARLTMHPLPLDDALGGAMRIPPPEEPKKVKKRWQRAKKAKK